uniref:Uncharacterized protein n=1 Tax=Spongospora subterranea TaxID=70186 RepID=A0A0H5RDN1_9EUKA|eukprot:CRZ11672.1 hypothetical protein [Spongospora subterranea]
MSRKCLRATCDNDVTERSNRAHYCCVNCRLMVRAEKARLRRKTSKQLTDGAPSLFTRRKEFDPESGLISRDNGDSSESSYGSRSNATVLPSFKDPIPALSQLAAICAARYRKKVGGGAGGPSPIEPVS